MSEGLWGEALAVRDVMLLLGLWEEGLRAEVCPERARRVKNNDNNKKKHNNLGSKIRQCLCLGTRRRLWGTPLGVLRGESCCGSTRVGVAAAAGGGRSCWDNTQLQRSVFLAGVDKANAVSGGSFFPVFFLPC